MTRRKRPAGDAEALRDRAEERIGAEPPLGGAAVFDGIEARRLVHELEVHQMELEIQNEELRAARAETERLLARYTELFDFAPIGYASLSPSGAILAINHAGAALLGLERARLVGKPLATFIAPRDRAALVALLDRAREADGKETCEVDLLVHSPARQLVLTAAVMAAQEPTLLLALEDISERKARDAELARSEKTLREADRRKDEFLAVLSHELRNPLAPIRNSLFVLGRAAPGSEEARKAQLIIDRQVTHLTRLVGDLLDVNRIRVGKIRLQRERIELGDLVRRTMEDQRASFESNGIALEGHFDPGLFWVNADASRLVQALSNLLGNCEKFTPRGGRVVVGLQRDGSHVYLRVRDTGIGIAAPLLERVFEPFAQAPQANDRTRGGLGLGLAMVKGLVELHGGTVSIASAGEGLGTEVTIGLLLEARFAPAADRSEPPETRSRRVLLIEDNADSADSLSAALTILGHVVEVAYDGATGLERARRFRPEVAICDIGLPGMDGYAVARVFRADEALRSVHLVALTGYAQPEDLHRATEAGFDRHVAKPTSLETLRRVLAEAPIADAPAGESPSPLH